MSRFVAIAVLAVALLAPHFSAAADFREMYASATGYVVSHREMFVVPATAPTDRLQVVVKVEARVRASAPVPVTGSLGSVEDLREAPRVVAETDQDSGDGDEGDGEEEEAAKPAPMRKVALTIRFELDHATLKGGEKAKLDSFVASLKEAKEVKVTGYTCDLGTQKHNDALAKARAHQVASYLVSHGIPARHVETNGLGKCCYVSKKREENRRAEVEGLVPEDGSTAKKLPAAGDSEKE